MTNQADARTVELQKQDAKIDALVSDDTFACEKHADCDVVYLDPDDESTARIPLPFISKPAFALDGIVLEWVRRQTIALQMDVNRALKALLIPRIDGIENDWLLLLTRFGKRGDWAKALLATLEEER